MILRSLVDLAEREQLLDNPSYQNAGVSFSIVLNGQGEFLSLADLRNDSGKRKQVPKILSIPKRTGRTVNDQEDFLVDKSEYVLGVEPDGKRTGEKLALRLDLFRASIQRAYSATTRAELKAAIAFLNSEEDRQKCIAAAVELKYKSNDLFCFEVFHEYLHDLPEIKQYWSELSEPDADGPSHQCLICGQVRPSVDKHNQIKLIGGSTSGISLVSFNAAAFESFGWSRNENARICKACANGYATALRRCLDSGFPDPKNPNVPIGKQSVVLSENLTAVYWTDYTDPELLASVESIPWFDDDAAASIAKQLESAWKGTASGSTEGRFYCLFLQGGQGRATLRGWHTERGMVIQDNLREWFRQTQVDERPRPLRYLLNSLALKGEGNKLPEHFIRSLFLAALFGRPLPLPVLAAAVERNKAEKSVSPGRAALLQAYFMRSTERKNYMGLVPDSQSNAYLLGRLLAVLQKQQKRLNPNLNKNITDRFFTSLSTRPASVFPALMSLARIHTSGLKEKGGFFEIEIAGLLSGVYPIPRTFSLTEQGEFALGFYHQRNTDIEGANANKAMKDAAKEIEDDAK